MDYRGPGTAKSGSTAAAAGDGAPSLLNTGEEGRGRGNKSPWGLAGIPLQRGEVANDACCRL